jgi:hypothetical protein
MPTHGNRDVDTSQQAQAQAPTGPTRSDGSGTGDMAFAYDRLCASEAGSPEDGNLAIQMAMRLLTARAPFQAQTAPAAYANAIDMLGSAAGPQYTVHGSTRLDTFDSAIRCLKTAEAGVDPAWIAAEYNPLVARERQSIVQGLARSKVEHVLGALDSNELTATTPDAELVALELRLDQLSMSFVEAEAFFTLSNASVAQKLGKALDWGEIAGDRIIVDPQTGAVRQFTSGAQITEFIGGMKSVLRTASAASKGMPDATALSDTGRLSEAFDLVKNVSEGAVGLAGLCCQGLAWTLAGLAHVSSNPATTANLAEQAQAFRGLAQTAASAPGISGTLAAIDVVRHALRLLAPDTESDDRLDAGVGLATAIVNAGGAVAKVKAGSDTATVAAIATAEAAATACTAAAVAIPITWLVFKATIRGLGDLRVASTGSMMVDDFEAMVAKGNAAADMFTGVTTSLMMRDRELDPDMRRGFDATANGFAENVSAFLANQKNPTGVFAGRVARAQLVEALDHPGATGACRDPTVVLDAVNQLTRHITWCLENAEDLIHDEAGFTHVSTPTKHVTEDKADLEGECEVYP